MKRFMLSIIIAGMVFSSVDAAIFDHFFKSKRDTTTQWVIQMDMFAGMQINRLYYQTKTLAPSILGVFGVGPAYQRQVCVGKLKDSTGVIRSVKNYTTLGIMPSILLFPNKDVPLFPYDIGFGLIITAFDGWGIGGGYNGGLVDKNMNRWLIILNYNFGPFKNSAVKK
jgi:hypothetical protein